MATKATPTPGEVLSWDVSALAGIADRSNQIADMVLKTSNSMHTVIHDLAWRGQARHAAEDKADREQTQMRTIATAFYDLGTACAGAARDMQYPLSEIKTIFEHYVVAPVTVADDYDGFIVIVDPSTTDHGTVYRPKDPLGEFIRLTNQATDPSLAPDRLPGGTGGTPPGKPGGDR
ncbi:hypothetical protein ACIHAX_06600 [Nocardia sp. NPDC051929]|uniref:hypothetical protein n=1 Tax=Nocardia sp. NPDC051929 TaxID=3364327 RepID=UPI0037C69A37